LSNEALINIFRIGLEITVIFSLLFGVSRLVARRDPADRLQASSRYSQVIAPYVVVLGITMMIFSGIAMLFKMSR
jgi:hypothetical protein